MWWTLYRMARMYCTLTVTIIHEVTSPQAFTGLKKRGIPVFRPGQVFATPDHNVPTIDQHLPIQDKLSRLQVEKLTENCRATRD